MPVIPYAVVIFIIICKASQFCILIVSFVIKRLNEKYLYNKVFFVGVAIRHWFSDCGTTVSIII